MPFRILKPCAQRQLRMGIRVEMEHTTSRAVAKCITKHHLTEEAEARRVPLDSLKLRYYTDLATMERFWKRRRR